MDGWMDVCVTDRISGQNFNASMTHVSVSYFERKWREIQAEVVEMETDIQKQGLGGTVGTLKRLDLALPETVTQMNEKGPEMKYLRSGWMIDSSRNCHSE